MAATAMRGPIPSPISSPALQSARGRASPNGNDADAVEARAATCVARTLGCALHPTAPCAGNLSGIFRECDIYQSAWRARPCLPPEWHQPTLQCPHFKGSRPYPLASLTQFKKAPDAPTLPDLKARSVPSWEASHRPRRDKLQSHTPDLPTSMKPSWLIVGEAGDLRAS